MRAKMTEPGQEALAREATRRESAAAFHRLAEAIGSAIFIGDGEQMRYVNRAAETITEYTREELLAMNFRDLVCPGSRELVISRRPMHVEDAELAPQGEFKILTKSGAERCLDVTAATIEFDGVSATLISAFDITERKRAEQQAQLLAMTDPLTGLGNYRRILEVLNAEIERSRRTGRSFALLLLDLDGLKEINDRYGHLVGNRALCRLGDVLRACCRAIDTVARYGGDEFSVILPETTVEAAGRRNHRNPPANSRPPVVRYEDPRAEKPSSSVHSRMIPATGPPHREGFSDEQRSKQLPRDGASSSAGCLNRRRGLAKDGNYGEDRSRHSSVWWRKRID